MAKIAQELRIMHACENGATGVYRGHKCAARYFFRDIMSDLEEMKCQEKEHSDRFNTLMKNREIRACYGSSLFYIGGIFYGAIIGLFGKKAIGTSTAVIEEVVCTEFEKSLMHIKHDKDVYKTVKEIQKEEEEHKAYGESLALKTSYTTGVVKKLANIGAYTAQFLASRL